MNRKIFVSLVFVLCVVSAAAGQVPMDVHVRILKAEDARRWDGELEKLITGNAAEPVVVRAMLAAGRIGDERAVPALSQRLRSGSPAVAAMAAFALGEIESITAADAILQRIGETGAAQLPGGGDPTAVRGRLAEAAGKIAAANSKDEKSKDLGKAIIFTLEWEINKGGQANRETILLGLTALLRARPEGTDVTAAKFLTHADGRVRSDALNTLARVRAKNANLVVRKILQGDPDVNARANAARVLGAAEDKEAFDLLMDAAVNGDDQRVRVSAIRALGSLKNAQAADKLLTRGEALLAVMAKTRKPNFIPSEQSEFIEISNALGQILAKSGNARAVALFKEFAKGDQWCTPEPYIARVKVGGFRPGGGPGGDMPQMTEWRQYSTLVQVIGELAAYEPESPEMKKIKDEAPEQIRKLATALIRADAIAEPEALIAAPDALRAFARFKTNDLAEVLREGLKNKDVFVRATAAELVAELPASPENNAALLDAFEHGHQNDERYNDATLAALEAYLKFEKEDLKTIRAALASRDGLVRAKAIELIRANQFEKKWPELSEVVGNARIVKTYAGVGTKNGQLLNSDADYRRALARKNGSVRAVFTTQKGVFNIDLGPEDAPLTVDNFVKLARSGYFNGLEVHRVVPNFVMQDGDPIGNGSGGPGWSIRCEINMVEFERGAVGMALSGKDTGGSQWFVTHSPQPHLDGGYTIFGRVSEKDMPVVDRIVRGDKILSVRVVEGRTNVMPAKRRK